MKRVLLSLILALSLFLTGCASMLNRSALFIVPHNQVPLAEGDSSIYQVESYQELVSALLYFVLQGQDVATLRMHNYTGNVEADLHSACQEVSQEDPVGAYAVDDIQFDVAHILNYYEAQLHFTYRRTHEQVNSIVPVVGTSAIRQELQEALAEFRTEVVLQINYFDQGEASLRTLLREAYYDTPQSGFGLPDVDISIYPDSGYQRVVEFQLSYLYEPERMRTIQTRILNRAESDTMQLYLQLPEYAFEQIAIRLRRYSGYSPTGISSIQFVVSRISPNSEALALALCLYGRELDLSCQVVKGTLDGVSHFWTIVKTSSGYRHLDPTRDEFLFLSDLQMTQRGYRWDTASVPTCIDPTESLPGHLPELPELPASPPTDLPILPPTGSESEF